jgi:hypothetical protein
MNFKDWLLTEEKYNLSLEIAHGAATSYGMHLGGEDDEPAEDCEELMKWHLHYEKWDKLDEIQQILQGNTCYVIERFSYTFHYCSIDISIIVKISPRQSFDIYELIGSKIEDYIIKKADYDYETPKQHHQFKFTTFNDAVKIGAWMASPQISTPKGLSYSKSISKPKPGESSEDYWQRQVRSRMSGEPPGRYNPFTGKWEKKWEGD